MHQGLYLGGQGWGGGWGALCLPSAQGWCPVSKNKAKEEPQGGPSARGVGPAASRTWLVLVHGVMCRKKWVPLGSWGRAQSLGQHLPVLTEPFWVSPSLQDSDGDKSDYNLVVDEVSKPWSLAGCPAQAAVVRFGALVPQLWGSLGSSSLLLGSSGQPGHVPALLQCLVPAKTDPTPTALGRLCQAGLSFASCRLGSASQSPFSPSAAASHMGEPDKLG